MPRLPALAPRTWALLLTAASCLFWIGRDLTAPLGHPWGDLSRGIYTDHFSHLNAARLFPRVGADLWRKPVGAMFRQLTPAEVEALPADQRHGGSHTGGIFLVEGWPKDKPLITSWSDKPRMYPPGDLLLVAPFALLYHFTPIGFTAMNRLLLAWFLLLAHWTLFLLFEGLCGGGGGGGGAEQGAGLLAVALAYGEIVHWSLEGFYDPVAIAPLVLCTRFLRERRGLAAAAAYCAAAFLHFRSFFLAPWSLYAAWLILREGQWRTWRRRDWALAAGAALLGLASLAVFRLDWATLKDLANNNRVCLTSNYSRPHVLNLAILLALCAAALCVVRAWMDLAILCWLSVALFTLREAYPWHIVIPLAWLGASLWGPATRHPSTVRGVRLLYLISAAALVFDGTLQPTWLQRLF